MLRPFIYAFVGMVFLYGCADVPKAPVVQESPSIVEDKIPGDVEDVPSVSADLLYELLFAEIAGQRNQFDVALDGYLKAATRTRDPKIAERATQIALFLKDPDRALQAITFWMDRDPKSVPARKAAAMVYLAKGDQDNALKQIEFWLQADNVDFERSMVELVQLLDKEADTPLQIMERLSKNHDGKPDFLLVYGLLALSKNNIPLALEKVDKALTIQPNWNKALILKARILARDGGTNPAAAQRFLGEMVKENPEDTDLRFIFGQFLLKHRNYKSARGELKQVVASDPKNYDALFALARVNTQLKAYGPARTQFLTLTEIPQWENQAYLFLGRLEADAENLNKALIWYDRIQSGALEVDGRLSAILVLAQIGRTREANQKLSRMRTRFPDQAVRLYVLESEILVEKKDYEKAFAVLDKALREIPDQPDLLYSRALVAERLDRLDVLEGDLSAILKKDPDDVNALNALGYTLVDRTERIGEAKAYLERAIELRPNDPVIIDSFGWLQYKLGNYDEALIYLRRAFENDPDPEIAAHLGEVLWISGHQDEAKAVWGKAMTDEPDNEPMQEIKKRFPGAFGE